MKSRWYFWVLVCALAATSASVNGGEVSVTALQVCKNSISGEFEVFVQESISDGDLNYKEYEDIKFGAIKNKYSFVQYADEDVVRLEDIEFMDFSRRGAKLTSENLAIDRSELYVRSNRKWKIYCLFVPFSGLGASGSFQRFSALIAVSVKDGKASKPIGEVVRARAAVK